MLTNQNPLATFIIFTYNHAAYIEEAVRGALAQTYEPLELIISDDCSTDQTFELAKRAASDYKGPHKLRIIKNDTNLGLITHVLTRCKEARGEFVIVAAGDDISKPNRAAEQVDALKKDESVYAVTSGFDIINDQGGLIKKNSLPLYGKAALQVAECFITEIQDGFVFIQGSTAAYRRSIFEFPLPKFEMHFPEDNLFNFLVYVNGGRVLAIEESLVLYRRHGTAMTNKEQKRLSFSDSEKKTLQNARRNLSKIKAFEWIMVNCSNPERIDVMALKSAKRGYELIANWPMMSLGERLKSLANELLSHRGKYALRQLTRIIGDYPEYQPRKLLSEIQRAVERMR